MIKFTEESIIKLFYWFGFDVATKGTQAIGDCPFLDCEASGKFYISLNESTIGLWDCKKCGRSGNAFQYLGYIYEQAKIGTSDEQYEELADERGGPPEAYKFIGYAWDQINDCWMLPCLSTGKDHLPCNIYEYRLAGRKDKRQWMGSPGLPAALWGIERMQSHTGTPAIICEGLWDGPLLCYALSQINYPAVITAVPGANTFKDTWAKHFEGSETRLFYDNDDAGRDGSNRTAFMLSGKAARVFQMYWPPGTPDKYDVSDELIAGDWKKKTIRETINRFESFCRPYVMEGNISRDDIFEDVEPVSFDELLESFRQAIYMTPDMEDALRIIFACVFSAQIPGDPLWMFLIGPPGYGKTEMLKSLQESFYAVYVSQVTPASLISGYRGKNGEDYSLIPKLKGRCLIIKDFTELMNKPKDEQAAVYSILRGAYDGRADRTFGNIDPVVYTDCYFSIVAAVTHAIHGHRQASLGERFLRFEPDKQDYDDRPQVRAASLAARRTGRSPMPPHPKNTLSAKSDDGPRDPTKHNELQELVRRYTSRHVTALPEPSDAPPRGKGLSMADQIDELARFVACIRTEVVRDFKGNPVYRPRSEVATRLAKQLTRLAGCLAFVEGKKTVQRRAHDLVKRVGLHTAAGWNLDIVIAILRNNNDWMSLHEIQESASIHAYTTVQLHVEDLMLLDVLKQQPRQRGEHERGGMQYEYAVTDEIVDMWYNAGLDKLKTY